MSLCLQPTPLPPQNPSNTPPPPKAKPQEGLEKKKDKIVYHFALWGHEERRDLRPFKVKPFSTESV